MSRFLKLTVLLLLALTPLMGGCHKAASPSDENAASTDPHQTQKLPITLPYRPSTPTITPATILPPAQTNWPKQGPRPLGILGLPMPVELSQEDKDRISFVAMTTSSWNQAEVKSFEWYAIIWAESSVAATVWTVDEQTTLKGIPVFVNPNALWYPGVTLTHVEGGVIYQKQVAFDYDSNRPVYSDGPYIPPGIPGH